MFRAAVRTPHVAGFQHPHRTCPAHQRRARSGVAFVRQAWRRLQLVLRPAFSRHFRCSGLQLVPHLILQGAVKLSATQKQRRRRGKTAITAVHGHGRFSGMEQIGPAASPDCQRGADGPRDVENSRTQPGAIRGRRPSGLGGGRWSRSPSGVAARPPRDRSVKQARYRRGAVSPASMARSAVAATARRSPVSGKGQHTKQRDIAHVPRK